MREFDEQLDASFQFPGHVGVEHELGDSVWSHWNFDPELLIPFVVLSFFYIRGLARWEERTRDHPWWRTALYFLGWLVLLGAVESPLDFLAERHFFAHMIQHELLIMVGMPLTLLGAPTTPVSRGLPNLVRRYLVSPTMRSFFFKLGRALFLSPIIAGVLVNAVIIAWHIPDMYNLVLTSNLIHRIQHLSFLIVAWLFWWNIIDPKPLHARMALPMRAIFIFLTGMPKHLVGAFLVFSSTFFYTGYLEFAPVFTSISRADDQTLGGLIMWVGALSIHLTAMGLTIFIWMRRQQIAQQRHLLELQGND